VAGGVSVERQFAEEVAMICEGMGLPRMVGRVLGWLLICDPPRQSSADLARALGVSKGSISTATRLLESAALVRRVAVAGARGDAFELVPLAFTQAVSPARLRVFRDLMDRGLAAIGDDPGPRGKRLRDTREFYAFVERESTRLVEQFRAEYLAREEGGGDD
jgi:hypothetical protein